MDNSTAVGLMEVVDDWRVNFYAPVADTDHLVVAGILIVLLTLGLTGNSTVIYIFATTRSLRTPSNMLLLNQAVVDLIMVLSCQPIMLYSSFKYDWEFGKLGCDIYGAFTSFGGVGSIISLTAIAYDRYVMICFGAESRRIASRARSMKIIVFVWLYASIFWAVPAMGYGGFILDGFKTSCTYDYVNRDLATRTFIVFMYIMALIVPATLIIYSYWSIYDTVSNSGPTTDKKEKKQLDKELAIAKVGMISVTFFMVAWLPYTIIALIGQFYGAGNIPPRLSTLPALFAKSACVYNAYIYGFAHPKYKYQVMKRFPCLPTPKESMSTTVNSQSAAAAN